MPHLRGMFIIPTTTQSIKNANCIKKMHLLLVRKKKNLHAFKQTERKKIAVLQSMTHLAEG